MTNHTDTTTDEVIKDSDREIVVDLPYVELVAERIRAFDPSAKANEEKSSPALGLGVVTVPGLAAAASKIRELAEDGDDKFGRGVPPATALDEVLIELRRYFRNKHSGWTPEMGKNRTVQGVHGTPHIGGGGYPMAAIAPDIQGPTDDPEVRVGLIDTRIYQNNKLNGRLDPDNAVQPSAEGAVKHLDIHGTFSVGRILQRAPEAAVITEAVLRHDDVRATVWEVATAMATFVDRDVKLLVLPLVCFTDDGEAPLALRRAVDLLRNNKIAVVAAAGNHGQDEPIKAGSLGEGKPAQDVRMDNRPGFPAACDGAFAVGAINEAGLGHAAFNPQDAPWIKLAGPGENVVSTSVYGNVEYVAVEDCPVPPANVPVQFNGGARWSGTSFATATIGGEIAARIKDTGKSAFEVIEDLMQLDSANNDGIGRY